MAVEPTAPAACFILLVARFVVRAAVRAAPVATMAEPPTRIRSPGRALAADNWLGQLLFELGRRDIDRPRGQTSNTSPHQQANDKAPGQKGHHVVALALRRRAQSQLRATLELPEATASERMIGSCTASWVRFDVS
ncbi:MAG: hypothetical protein R2706_12910 [Acidimicrobiales bacterium]